MVCGIAILVLGIYSFFLLLLFLIRFLILSSYLIGSVANIMAEEEYSEHVDRGMPLNLKDLDDKFNAVHQLTPIVEQKKNSEEMIGDSSLQELLPSIKNRSA